MYCIKLFISFSISFKFYFYLLSLFSLYPPPDLFPSLPNFAFLSLHHLRSSLFITNAFILFINSKPSNFSNPEIPQAKEGFVPLYRFLHLPIYYLLLLPFCLCKTQISRYFSTKTSFVQRKKKIPNFPEKPPESPSFALENPHSQAIGIEEHVRDFLSSGKISWSLFLIFVVCVFIFCFRYLMLGLLGF
jgi:hypothetical protein